MSGISGVSSTGGYYGQIASGSKLQSAADGAAELTISEGEKAQINGYNAGTNNMQSAQDMLNVADGAMESITDYLQRMRELAVQGSNGILSSSDRSNIQAEIEQLKQGISDVAAQTSFNANPLLDGSRTDYQLATNANGDSTTVSTANATIQALGIADFDITGDFSLQTIDDALQKVSESRSSMGAQSNGLSHAISYNNYTAYNLTAANSRLEDLDYPQAVSDKKKQETLQTYQLLMQRRKQQDEEARAGRLFT